MRKPRDYHQERERAKLNRELARLQEEYEKGERARKRGGGEERIRERYRQPPAPLPYLPPVPKAPPIPPSPADQEELEDQEERDYRAREEELAELDEYVDIDDEYVEFELETEEGEAS